MGRLVMARRVIKSKGPIKLQYIPPDLPKLKPQQQTQIMRQLAQTLILLIQSDTQDGLDANLQPFEPYSPLYARIRAAAGYSTQPDMTVTGQMLNSMVVKTYSRTRFTLGFNDSASVSRKSLVEQAWGGLNKQDRSAIWAMAGAAKARAGKPRNVPGRRSPVASTPKVSGPPISGAPAPRNSEKAEWTNRLRPWFTIGPVNGERFKEMVAVASELVAAALK
tara:strand:- start:1530 stop:2192 length:663 start_codon:yes stop_codon:yes gene_type:complete